MTSFDFDKTAKLSHLEFSENEKENFIKDMESIFSLADTLCALDDTDAPENECILETPLADDEPVLSDKSSLVLQSKRNDGTFVVVPGTFSDGGNQ